jgi:flagellar biosynthesis GTPase FlhF
MEDSKRKGITIDQESGAIIGENLFDQAGEMVKVSKLVAIANSYKIDSPVMRDAAYNDLTMWKRGKAALEEKRLTVTRPLDAAKAAFMALFATPTAQYDMAIGVIQNNILTYDNAERAKVRAEQERLEALAKAERQRIEAEAAEVRRKAAEAERAEKAKAEALEREAEQAARQGDTEAVKAAQEAAARIRAEAEAKAREARDEAAAHASVAAVMIAPVVAAPEQAGGRVTWKGRCDDKMKLLLFIVANPSYANLVEVDQTALNQVAKAQKDGMKIDGCTAFQDRGLSAARR